MMVNRGNQSQLILGLLATALAGSGCGDGSSPPGQGNGSIAVDPPPQPAVDPSEMGGEVALEEVQIEFPRAIFIGTPKNNPDLKVKVIPKNRSPLTAPAGTVNVALGKAVTASDDEPIIGDLEQVTDGDKEGTDGSFVEFGFGKQWVQIDLGERFELWGVVAWHYHSSERVYHDVVVQVSSDADFISDVETIYNNDADNSSGLGIGEDPEYFESNLGKMIRLDGSIIAQFIRLYTDGSTDDDQNHYVEVEVYGRKAP